MTPKIYRPWFVRQLLDAYIRLSGVVINGQYDNQLMSSRQNSEVNHIDKKNIFIDFRGKFIVTD